jgi:hypothetical protein
LREGGTVRYMLFTDLSDVEAQRDQPRGSCLGLVRVQGSLSFRLTVRSLRGVAAAVTAHAHQKGSTGGVTRNSRPWASAVDCLGLTPVRLQAAFLADNLNPSARAPSEQGFLDRRLVDDPLEEPKSKKQGGQLERLPVHV